MTDKCRMIMSFLFVSHIGTVEVLAYPSLKALDTLMAHTAGCYCIAIDPLGRYCDFLFHLSCLEICLHR